MYISVRTLHIEKIPSECYNPRILVILCVFQTVVSLCLIQGLESSLHALGDCDKDKISSLVEGYLQ